MKSLRYEKDLKKDNIVKDIRNLFGLQKKVSDTAIKDIRNLFRLKKESEVIKNKVIKDIRNLFEHEEKDYYEPNSGVTIILNMKIMVIEVKLYQLENILIKLDHI